MDTEEKYEFTEPIDPDAPGTYVIEEETGYVTRLWVEQSWQREKVGFTLGTYRGKFGLQGMGGIPEEIEGFTYYLDIAQTYTLSALSVLLEALKKGSLVHVEYYLHRQGPNRPIFSVEIEPEKQI